MSNTRRRRHFTGQEKVAILRRLKRTAAFRVRYTLLEVLSEALRRRLVPPSDSATCRRAG